MLNKKRILILSEISLKDVTGGYRLRLEQLTSLFSENYQIQFICPNPPKDFLGFSCKRFSYILFPYYLLKTDILLSYLGFHIHRILPAFWMKKKVILDSWAILLEENRAALKYANFGNANDIFDLEILFQLEVKLCTQFIVSGPGQIEYLRKIKRNAEFYELPLSFPDENSLKEAVPSEEIVSLFSKKRVLLWGGGIWPWFDYDLLLNSFREIAQEFADVVLFLPAGHQDYYNEFATDIINRVENDSVLKKSVFLNRNWLTMEERSWVFRRSYLGLNTNLNTQETATSYRTRVRDYLQHGVPVICTQGDYLSSVIDETSCGRVHSFGNQKKMVADIRFYLNHKDERNTALKNCEKAINILKGRFQGNISKFTENKPKKPKWVHVFSVSVQGFTLMFRRRFGKMLSN